MNQKTHLQSNRGLYNIPQLKDMINEKLDAVTLLETFGAEITKESYSEIRCPCPIHGGDNPTAFVVRLWVGDRPAFFWQCHTGCDDKGDVFDFIQLMTGMEFKEAMAWAASFVGIELEDTTIGEEVDFNSMREIAQFNHCLRRLKDMPSDTKFVPPQMNEIFIQECMRRRNNYFRNRGFGDDVLDLFEIGFCPAHVSPWIKTKYRARATVPLRDEIGRLVGISGRIIVELENPMDKYNILPGSKKSDILYGLHMAMPFIKEKNSVILVEGFSDVWRSWQHGIRNVVALCGKELTPKQKKLLLSICNTVAIAVDNDEHGMKGGDKIQNQLIDFLTVFRVILPEGKDIGDILDRDEYYNCLKKAKKQFEKIEHI